MSSPAERTDVPLGSPTVAGTKRQAETALAKLVTEVGNDQVAKHQPGTLADLLRPVAGDGGGRSARPTP